MFAAMEVHMPGRSSKPQEKEKGKGSSKQERGSEKKSAGGNNRKSSR
jgi:hypothetical protein